MADARTFAAKIELTGKLHASMSGAVKLAQNQLNRLAQTARKMGEMVGKGFSKLGALVKSFAGQVIGLTLAFAGLHSASAFLAKSKEQFRENELAAAELNSVLANNPRILKLGEKELARQQKRFSDLADQMQGASAYASSTWRAAFTGLAQWGAGAQDAEKLSGFINDILAGRHGLKATAGDAKSLGDALGKVIRTGKIGKFGKEFGLGKADEERFGRLKTAAERIDYLQKQAAKYRGRAAALGTTEAYKIQQAENRIADFQSKMGAGFARIEGKWIRFVDKMLPRIEPVINKLTELFERFFDDVVVWVEEVVLPAWDEFVEALGDPDIKKLVDGLKKDFDAIAGAVGKIYKQFAKWLGLDQKTMKQDLHDMIQMFRDLFQEITDFINMIIDGLKWIKNFATAAPLEQAVGGGSVGTQAAIQARGEQAAAAGASPQVAELEAQISRTRYNPAKQEALRKRLEKLKAEEAAAQPGVTPTASYSEAVQGMLTSEGYRPGYTQGGRAELFGFRAGESTGYSQIAAAARRGGETEARAVAGELLAARGAKAGAGEFEGKPGVQAAITSMAHMRGEGGAQAILNMVAGGDVQKSGRLTQGSIDAINSMSNQEFQSKLADARWRYDEAVYGSSRTSHSGGGGRWGDVYGKGLRGRYAREAAQYGAMNDTVAAAEGGIFRQPTNAIIGEAGPEAVLPLPGPVGAAANLGQAMEKLWGGGRQGSSFNVNYNPNFTVNGGGPNVLTDIERIVRAGHDELLKQIEALDGEMMRRAFI